MATKIQACNRAGFSKDYPEISEANIEAAINPTQELRVARGRKQRAFIDEAKKVFDEKELQALYVKCFNRRKKCCRVKLQRLQQEQKDGQIKTSEFRHQLEKLLDDAPMHSSVKVQVVRALIKSFY